MRATSVIFAVILLAQPIIYADEPVSHRVLAADRETGRLAIIGVDGKVEWEVSNKHDVHDLHLLDNGNILTHISHTTIVEINPKKEVVWKYEAKPKPGYNGKIEVHAFHACPMATP
ncbi:MAG: hypothetical protein QM703_19625 [Gemmatales bacterium]